MSKREDMADCQYRNEFGLHAGGSSAIHAPIDNSTNKPLPWIVVACIIGSMALMGVILMPMIIDAKVRAGSAKCEAVADLARTDAAVAKDTVDQWAAKQKAGAK